MIKVLVERRVRREKYSKLITDLTDLRAACLHQPGYVTGETLVKGNDPVDVLVISTWISEAHWKAWATSEARIVINDLLTQIIEGEPRINIYKLASEEY